MAEIRIYDVDALGKPVGPYSHVARQGRSRYPLSAGMLASGETFEAQCAVYGQIEKALQSAGGGWANVVQFTTYLVHSQDIEVLPLARARVPAHVSRRTLPAERCSSSTASSRSNS